MRTLTAPPAASRVAALSKLLACAMSRTSSTSRRPRAFASRTAAREGRRRAFAAALAALVALLCPAIVRAQQGAWVLRSATGGPSARSGHALVYDSARERVVLFGGFDGTNRLGDTWEWDGTAWTQVATSGPSARVLGPGLAYDSARRRVVLFGGYDGQYRDDTWEWDGTAWTERAVAGPTARNAHALTYDSARGRVLLFGGGGGADDTWAWDGSTWSQVALGVPAGRGGHGMVFDDARERAVVFGGRSGSIYRSDTWEWDGGAWIQVATSGPSARYQLGMCFDSARQRSVLFGGYYFDTAPHFYADTWEWDGSAWIQRAVVGPSARNAHAMVYDEARDRVVLFGGVNGTQSLGDTWEWGWTYATQIVEGYLVTAPNGNRLWVKVIQPRVDLYPGQSFPAIVNVPGGLGAGASGNLQMAASGFVEFHFNAEGRGTPPRVSDGVEDCNGFLHQDDLKAVIEYAHALPNVQDENVGVMTSSYGITMGAGCLGRYSGLQVKYLLDIEGPSDSFVTCFEPWALDSDPSNDRHQLAYQIFGHWSIDRDPSPANVAWWSEREATRYIGGVRCCYLRVQAQWDHAQPPNAQWPGFDFPPLWYPCKHTVDMVNLATTGGAPWTRVNGASLGNATNTTYDRVHPPAYYAGSYAQNVAENQRLLRELSHCSACSPGAPAVYCTAKTNSLGCVPAIAASGAASASSALPFEITVDRVLNGQNVLLFYGYGRNSTPFNGGRLCVQPPLRRTPVQDSGGSTSGDDCTGAASYDMNARIQVGVDPGLAPGVAVCAQYYYRDPDDAHTVGLSDAVQFVIQP